MNRDFYFSIQIALEKKNFQEATQLVEQYYNENNTTSDFYLSIKQALSCKDLPRIRQLVEQDFSEKQEQEKQVFQNPAFTQKISSLFNRQFIPTQNQTPQSSHSTVSENYSNSPGSRR